MLRWLRANRYLTMHAPEYYSDSIMVGSGVREGNFAYYTVFDLFNDDQRGATIHLYNFQVFDPINSSIQLFPVVGHIDEPIDVIPLNPLSGALAGKLYSGLVNDPPTTAYYSIQLVGQPYSWPYPYPVASIPAGRSLRFQTNGTDLTMEASFWWLVEPSQ